MTGDGPTARQAAADRAAAAEAEIGRLLAELGPAMRAWAAAQRHADEAFLAVLRLQGALGAARYAQTAARLALVAAPDGPAVAPMDPGLQA